MAIIAEPTVDKKLTSLDESMEWIKETEQNIARVPINEFLKRKSNFSDDEYFGDGDYKVRFNERGFQLFCNILGFRTDMIKLIEKPNLATQVLNDLLYQNDIRNKFEAFDFVLDTNKRIVVGIVSGTYIGYSNMSFIEDIETLMNELDSSNRLNFFEAYSINTELTLIYKSVKKHGEIVGKGGRGPDKSEFGMQFKNSMVGTSSVNMNYYLFRLACANGMMVPAAQSINKVYHSGYQESFNSRLKNCFKEVFRKIDQLQDLLYILGDIQFNPELIGNNKYLNDKIFDIIPGTKQELCFKYNEYLKYPKGITEEERRDLQIQHDIYLIRKIPEYYNGNNSRDIFQSSFRDSATMFDFLNIFTEQAKSKPLYQKLSIEEKTGGLAKYIKENAKKFS